MITSTILKTDDAAAILAHLTHSGVQVWTENGQMRLRAPAGLLNDQVREHLTKHKAAILEMLYKPLSDRPAAAAINLVPAPAERHLPFPLTDIQRAYWIGRQQAFELGHVSIHYYTEVDCQDLDLQRLTQAWNRVIARHEMLRAIIREDGEQVMLESVPPYQPAVFDLRQMDPEAAAAALIVLREQLSHEVRPADCWPGFELRASLLDSRRTRLHVSLDLLHIDGASLLVIFQDLIAFYHNPEVQLPPLEFSYRDYVLAERQLQESAPYEKDLEYWRQRLPLLPPAPELPLAKNPGQLDTTRFVRRTMKLEAGAFANLRERAAALGLTPTGIFLTAFAEIIGSWSKSADFTLNITLFNRLPVHPQVGQIVGDFTSMILLGVSQRPGELLLERARRLQQQLWEDLDHRRVSGVKVLAELNKFRQAHSGGIMPVVFTSLLNLAGQGFSTQGITALGEEVYTITQTPQIYLDHQVKETPDGGVELCWDAVEAIFPAGMLDDMFGAYRKLLRCLVEEEASWQQTRWCHTPAAQLEQRAAVNATAVPVLPVTLYTLFTAQARQRPAQPAVIAANGTLSYGELLRRAERLGRHLRRGGAQPNELIAVVMEKGLEQVVGVLGTHAAGAAYVPIDPELPVHRRDQLLNNAQVRVVLTQSRLDTEPGWPPGIERICVDAADLSGLGDGDGPLEPVQEPGDLSHVIYTSGSTGQPKGVMIEHRSVVNRLLDINRRFAIGPEDRALAITALHHDLSVFDIFGVLAAGGSIVIPEAAVRRDPAHWLELLAQHQVTLWNSVPTFLEMLLDFVENHPEAAVSIPASLRWVILAGDWIPVNLPDRLRSQVPTVRLIASGGPTETTIWDVAYEVDRVDPGWKSIPYGKPLANAQYHVLDQALEPRPVWVPGELYIGGAGLARGYWRDESKTQQKFISHPQTGERLYRSGDWGRYLPDGNIEFLGRDDFQVKIHGQRIELGEIEAVLKQYPQVRAAVATVDQGGPGLGKRLVAYVVPTPGRVDIPRSKAHKPAPDQSESAFGQLHIQLTDPAERLAFKLEYRGLRRSSPETTSYPLARPATAGETCRPHSALHSHRHFSQEAIEFERFSTFLSALDCVKLNGLLKFRYGSAGGLYPVQTYVHIKPGRVEGLAPGLYYYHPYEHRLDWIAAAEIDKTVHFANSLAVNQPVFEEAAFSLFFFGQLEAIAPMYGELARDFCMIEAGMISQLLRESAAACDMGICQIGHFHFDRIRPLFALEDSQIPLHSLVGGRAVQEQLQARVSRVSLAEFQKDLLDFLRNRLPQHMVPASIILLNALPLTANGKVDRRSLPLIERADVRLEISYVPPHNTLETTIAGLWQEMLSLEQVGVNHNFFDLGADSALVVQAYHRLRKLLGRDFPLLSMFKYPTTHALAEFLSEEEGQSASFEKSRDRAALRRQLLQQQKKPELKRTF